MNNKILVNVYVPIIEEGYDVWIPISKRIDSVIALLVMAIKDLSGGTYNPNKIPLLYDRNTAKCYSEKDIVKKTDIKNGSKLILI